jgi:hypothetical protein
MNIVLIILITFSVPIGAYKCPVFFYWYGGGGTVEKHSCKMSFEVIM